MTSLILAAILSFAAQFVLQTPGVWWFLAAARPYLVTLVAAAPRLGPLQTGWFGLALGLVADLLDEAPIGPRGISGAVAGLVTSLFARRFELEGPLFWSGGTVLACLVNDLAFRAVVASLGASPSWGWWGTLASTVATGMVALVVAAGASLVRAATSPTRRRRRLLKRL